MAPVEDIIKQIEQADEIQLNNIISAVNRRYAALHTDRVGGFLSLPTDPRTHDKVLEETFSFIRACYNRQK